MCQISENYTLPHSDKGSRKISFDANFKLTSMNKYYNRLLRPDKLQFVDSTSPTSSEGTDDDIKSVSVAMVTTP